LLVDYDTRMGKTGRKIDGTGTRRDNSASGGKPDVPDALSNVCL